MTTATVDKLSYDAPSGYTIYIYDVTITNTGTVSHLVDELGFTLISTSNAVYAFTLALAIRQSLPSVQLSPGQHTSGQIAFQVANGDTPAKLEYKIPFDVDELVTNLPQPTRWVSSVTYADVTLQGNVSSYYLASATVVNQTEFFYSTDRMVVNITLQAFNQVESIQVVAISVANADFKIVSVNPALPATAKGDTTETSFALVLTMPQASVDIQDLCFTVVTTP